MATGDYTVKSGDNIYNIVKNQYKFKSKADIMALTKKVMQDNKIRKDGLIKPGQVLKLNSELSLKGVTIFSDNAQIKFSVKDGNTNFYRNDAIFGNIATKPEEFPDEQKRESSMKAVTQSTPEVDDVVLDVRGAFTSETDRDARMFDIAAKPAGVGGFKDMKGTAAYNRFLEVNSDDYQTREVTDRNGTKETVEFFNPNGSDGKITAFSSEIIDGQEFHAIKDKNGKPHYYNLADPQYKDYEYNPETKEYFKPE